MNEAEADIVRFVSQRYLELGSAHALVSDLAHRGVRSKVRTLADGSATGGQPFSRGAVFHLLKNRICVGQNVHKGEAHRGLHEAIVARDPFDEVQGRLDANRYERSDRTSRTAPLAGRLYPAVGRFLPDLRKIPC